MKRIDLTGQRFGRLVVIGEAPSLQGRSAWLCKCDCGREHIVAAHDLRKKRGTRSCGCTTRRIDLTGQDFGELHVLRYVGNGHYECKCSCGVIKSMYSSVITRCGSCGHIQREMARERAASNDNNLHISRIINMEQGTTKVRSSSGHRGVYPIHQKAQTVWIARITYKGTRYDLGIFSDIDDAVAARETAEKHLWSNDIAEYIAKMKEDTRHEHPQVHHPPH